MSNQINLQSCLARVKGQYPAGEEGSSEFKPAITISRMSGVGGDLLATYLVDYLQPLAPPGRQWAVYDKNFMVKVLEEHGLSATLADSLPEAKEPLLTHIMNKLRAGHPSAAKMAELAVETVWRLAAGGYVILVGRAANVITAELKHVFHVRLVASVDRRVEQAAEAGHCDRNAAQKQLISEDEAKRLYMKEYFGREIDDPELYHLIVNTDLISCSTAARLIGDCVINCFQLKKPPVARAV